MSQPSLDLELEDDPADPTFTVRELADGINAVLQRGFRDGVWVRGEIQGFQERANGHIYFNLTEDGDEGKATVSVVLFGGTYRRLAPMLRRSRSAVVRRRCVARKMRSMATTAVAELHWSSTASSTRNRGG